MKKPHCVPVKFMKKESRPHPMRNWSRQDTDSRFIHYFNQFNEGDFIPDWFSRPWLTHFRDCPVFTCPTRSNPFVKSIDM